MEEHRLNYLNSFIFVAHEKSIFRQRRHHPDAGRSN